MAFNEPFACVVNSINRTDIQQGDDVVIIGGGTMGLLHVMVAKCKDARVIVSDPLADRREKALELGAANTIDLVNTDAVKRVLELTEGRGSAVVFIVNEFNFCAFYFHRNECMNFPHPLEVKIKKRAGEIHSIYEKRNSIQQISCSFTITPRQAPI